MEPTSLLATLGLPEPQTRLYLAALQLGSASTQELANKLQVSRTTASSTAQQLAAAGFLRRHPGKRPRRYTAVNPRELMRLAARQRRAVEIALPQLLTLYHQHGQPPRIQLFEGRNGTKEIWEDTLRIPDKLIRNIDAMPSMGHYRAMDKDFMDDYVRRRIAARVSIREIRFPLGGVETVWPASPSDRRDVHYAQTPLNLQVTILMYDGSKVALLDPMAATYGVLIESADFYQTMENLFEVLWRYTKPAARND